MGKKVEVVGSLRAGLVPEWTFVLQCTWGFSVSGCLPL